MTAQRVIGGIGRTLLVTGVLVLLFVAYQLWGTALQERRAQDRLEDEFAEVLAEAGIEDTIDEVAAAPPESTDDDTSDDATDDATDDEATTGGGEALPARFGPPPPAAEAGDPVARLRIPALGLDKVVISGVSTEDLKEGPGHFPGTPLPGQAGNAAIAGHRTTYGAPFFDFDDLVPGDEVFVTTLQGTFTYEVTSSEIVPPTAIEVLAPTDDDRLTFTTCHPKYSAAERLIVVAHLVGEAAPGGPSPNAVAPTELPTEDLDDPARTADTVLAEGEGGGPADAAGSDADEAAATTDPAVATAGLAEIDLGGDLDGASSSRVPVVIWGLVCALLWIGGWLLGRTWRRWPAYAVTTPFFLVALFVFYENVSRLLPANV
ncbi:MAG: class E sortase [Actinomycetota bacterium]